MLQYFVKETVLLFSNSSFQSEESTTCFIIWVFHDWDKGESHLDIKHVFDADVPYQQERSRSFEGNFKFLVNDFGRRDLSQLVVVEIQKVVESVFVDLFVAVGHKETQLLSHELSFADLNHAAEPPTDWVDDQFVVVLQAKVLLIARVL